MYKKILMVVAGAALLVAAVAAVWWGGGSKPPVAKKEEGAPVSHVRPRPKMEDTAAKKDREPAEAPVVDPAEQAKRDEAKRAVLLAINEAATTYDAAQLPFINKYLYDKDPDIRKAAMEAMLVLGDASAGKLLREASQTAATEEERQTLAKAADYAELPTVDFKTMMQQKKLREANGAASGDGATAENVRKKRNRIIGKRREENPAPAPDAPPAGTPAPVPAPAPAQGQ